MGSAGSKDCAADIKPSEGLVLRRLENDDEHWRKDAGELTKGKQSIPLIAWVGGDDKEEEEE